MITYEEFLKAVETVKKYKEQCENHIKDVCEKSKGIDKLLKIDKNTRIWDLDCSTRLLNSLNGYFIYTKGLDPVDLKVLDFSKISMTEISKRHHFGKGTLKELKEICYLAEVEMQP